MSRTSRHDGSGPWVSKSFPRATHRALLLSCGVDLTRRFWEQNPLTLDGFALDPIAFATFLAADEGVCSMSFVGSIMNGLEPFLIEHGVPVDPFCDSLMAHANGGSHVDAKTLLALSGPFWVILSRIGDPHRMFLRMCQLTCRTFLPGFIFHEASAVCASGRQRKVCMVLGYPELWLGQLAPWDPSLFMVRMLKRMPASLGLTPFTEVRCIADAREPCEIDGSVADTARSMTFRQFCREREIELRGATVPDRNVLYAENDVHSTQRKRVVLSAGSVCGAPVYLIELHWSLDRTRLHGAFQHLIDEATGRTSLPEQARVETLMREYLGQARAHLRCRFVEHEQRLYVNDRPIVRGIPALILHHCLREHVAHGRSEFSFRELKGHSAFVSHPKNTGLEVRLRRLQQALAAAACGIWIAHTHRGHFVLQIHGDIELDTSADVMRGPGLARS